MNKWHVRFLLLAKHVAAWSKDKSKQVGCVIVDDDKRIISVGYNGFPAGINDNIPERHERPEKYKYTEHAERNAIFTAARIGVSLKGAILYSTFCPCSDCARGIIQAGIKEVYCDLDDCDNPRWKEDFEFSRTLLKEAGIQVYLVPNVV